MGHHTHDDNTGENIKDALKADWEQTKADMPGMDGRELDQDVDDTLRQAAGKEDSPVENG